MQYETSFYEKLYFYYAEQQEFQKALFVKKYYLEGFCEWRKLRVEMGFRDRKTFYRCKKRIKSDILYFVRKRKDVRIPEDLKPLTE